VTTETRIAEPQEFSSVSMKGASRSTLEGEFDSVAEFAQDTNPYLEPYERGPVFICRGLHENLQALWPMVKNWE
jgi:hypothetical protein